MMFSSSTGDIATVSLRSALPYSALRVCTKKTSSEFGVLEKILKVHIADIKRDAALSFSIL